MTLIITGWHEDDMDLLGRWGETQPRAGRPSPQPRSQPPSPTRRDPRTGLVVLGAHDLHTAEATQQVFSISAIFMHPDYHPATHTSDICLLQVRRCVGDEDQTRVPGPPRWPDLFKISCWDPVSTSAQSREGEAHLKDPLGS